MEWPARWKAGEDSVTRDDCGSMCSKQVGYRSSILPTSLPGSQSQRTWTGLEESNALLAISHPARSRITRDALLRAETQLPLAASAAPAIGLYSV